MNDNDLEREANVFALFLLMPQDLLVQEIHKLEGTLDWTDGKGLKKLCETFGVTQTALVVRMGLLPMSAKKKLGLI